MSSDGSDNNDLMISSQELSPYNPEAASPLDLGSSDDDLSPGIAALEDRTGVDFHAYKDVVAFEDIMKSKVKHEARKHKRKKLEDMKTKLDNDETTSKTDVSKYITARKNQLLVFSLLLSKNTLV